MNRFEAIIAEEDTANVATGTKKPRTRTGPKFTPPVPDPGKTLDEKLRDGDYQTKVEYPSRPKGVPEASTTEAYHAARRAYGEDVSRLEEEFKKDLFAEHEVTNNPKAALCYSIAWSHGHSAGYGEVANYFSEFVELIK